MATGRRGRRGRRLSIGEALGARVIEGGRGPASRGGGPKGAPALSADPSKQVGPGGGRSGPSKRPGGRVPRSLAGGAEQSGDCRAARGLIDDVMDCGARTGWIPAAAALLRAKGKVKVEPCWCSTGVVDSH